MPGEALDDVWHTIWVNPNGNRYFAYLNNWNGQRKVNLNYDDNEWNANCRFLAFRNFLFS